jgi:hypothetical protein
VRKEKLHVLDPVTSKSVAEHLMPVDMQREERGNPPLPLVQQEKVVERPTIRQR